MTAPSLACFPHVCGREIPSQRWSCNLRQLVTLGRRIHTLKDANTPGSSAEDVSRLRSNTEAQAASSRPTSGVPRQYCRRKKGG